MDTAQPDKSQLDQTAGLDPAAEGLNLPAGLVLLASIAKGRFSRVYKASFQGETLALKAYNPQAIDWYRKHLDKNIAIMEMAQNRAFRQVPELLPYTARPVRVIGQDGKHSLSFLQEWVDGKPLLEVVEEARDFPGYLMTTGEMIARTCEEHELAGVDQFMKDVLLRRHQGTWSPMLHDFKHLPQAAKPKPAGPSLLARFGIGGRQEQATGFIRDWKALARKYERAGA